MIAVPAALQALPLLWEEIMQQQKANANQDRQNRLDRAFKVQKGRWQRGIDVSDPEQHFWEEEVISPFKAALGGKLRTVITGIPVNLNSLCLCAECCAGAGGASMRPELHESITVGFGVIVLEGPQLML